MDELVAAALQKWPNVPHCYGWLALDARGNWWMRDEATQRAGAFPAAKGSRISHEKLLSFIARNYAADECGAWFFQNGPQRVYVELEATPWIWRLQPSGQVLSHTGQPAVAKSSWLDEAGHLYLLCAQGFGLVHSADMHLAAEAVEQGHWAPQTLPAHTLPQRFGFVRSPSPQ